MSHFGTKTQLIAALLRAEYVAVAHMLEPLQTAAVKSKMIAAVAEVTLTEEHLSLFRDTWRASERLRVHRNRLSHWVVASAMQRRDVLVLAEPRHLGIKHAEGAETPRSGRSQSAEPIDRGRALVYDVALLAELQRRAVRVHSRLVRLRVTLRAGNGPPASLR